MKKLILVIILFALAPLSAMAQTPIERELEQLGLKGVSFTISSIETKPAPAAKPASPAFSVDFTHVPVSILPNTDKDTNVTIHGNITNLTDQPLQLGFVRQQQLAHPHWKSAVCFGINCYADWISATVSNEPWAPNETRELVMHIRTPPGAQGTGDIRLALYAPATGDTVVVTYRATMEPVPVVQCRTFWFDNPYNGDVKFREVYVENPDLFDVEVMSDTTYEIFNKDIISVRFCLKKTDEAQYSTNVVFVTDSGTFKQEFTMQTPSAGVRPVAENNSGVRILSVSPNPAAASQQIQVNLESSRTSELTLSIVDLLGRELRSIGTTAGIGSIAQKLSIGDLSAGTYMLLVKENGVVLDQTSFNVAR